MGVLLARLDGQGAIRVLEKEVGANVWVWLTVNCQCSRCATSSIGYEGRREVGAGAVTDALMAPMGARWRRMGVGS